MFLITYRCEGRDRVLWGYSVDESPIDWLIRTQEFEDETYYIVNVLPISKKVADEIDGTLNGM